MDQNTIGGNRHERRRQQSISRRQDGGDAAMEARGKVDQATGDMEKLYGQAKDAAADVAQSVQQGAKGADDLFRRSIEERPYTTAFAALAIGWLMGRMRRHY